MHLKKIIAIIVICTFVIITYTGCGSEEPVSKTEFLLDTVCAITVYNMDQDDGAAALAKGFQACTDYEKLLSKTVKGSDIDKINHGKGSPVKVDPATYKLVGDAIEYARVSKGKFDITIGAVSDLWDFKSDHPKVPPKEKIEAALKTVDYHNVVLMKDNRIRLKNPDTRLDLGGVAKGYIADRAAEAMEDAGVKQAIINLGGNIVAVGEKEEGVPWNIGIERPYTDRSAIIGSVPISDGSIVTSGIYERNFTVDGKLYHHVLDPQTGYPAKTKLEAVSIQGPKGASEKCDAYSTICLILGTEKGKQLIESEPGFKAAFIDQEDNVKTTKDMKIAPVE